MQHSVRQLTTRARPGPPRHSARLLCVYATKARSLPAGARRDGLKWETGPANRPLKLGPTRPSRSGQEIILVEGTHHCEHALGGQHPFGNGTNSVQGDAFDLAK